MPDFTISEIEQADWPQILAVYNEGIETGIAAFSASMPDRERFEREHIAGYALAARLGQKLLGWAALAKVSSLCALSGAAEVSVYIAKDARGKGIGAALVGELIKRSEEAGFWSLQAEILRENAPSRRLFQKCGFREIGFRERLGQTPDGIWHDVVLAERRSAWAG